MKYIRNQVSKFLQTENFAANLKYIHELPAKKTINALFSFLCSPDRHIKERAIIAMGEVVSKYAEKDLEAARMVMRRLMWSLNEESGWIGWGAAEAMGEIMARNQTLAEEYSRFLISYISEGDNFLQFEDLRNEVFAGLKRVSEVYPHLTGGIKNIIV